jgi:hypothetical protein
MKVKHLVLCAGAVATASAFGAPRQLQTMEWSGITLQPTHYAPLYIIDGVEVRGEMQPVSDFGERLDGYGLTWDSFQGDQTVAADFPPVGGDVQPCALAASSRYFFGTAAANVHWCNDFNGQAPIQTGQPISHVRMGYYHNPMSCPTTGEPLRIDLIWYNDFNGNCDFPYGGTDSINAARGFIVGYSFVFSGGGAVPCGNGYYTLALTIPNPPSSANMPDSDGAYRGRALRTNPTGAPTTADFSSRGQTMLWGTQGDANGPYGGQPRPGTAGNIIQWDDDGGANAPAQPPILADNIFQNDPAAPLGVECYSYAFAVCYRPLGAMAAWFNVSCSLPPAFGLFSPANGSGPYDPNNNLNFSWEVSNPPPSSYTLTIASDSGMNNVVYQQGNITLDNWDVPGGTLSGGNKFWRVTANAGTGCPGRNSEVWSFSMLGGDPCDAADWNGDGQVDFFDYLDFVQDFSDDNADYNNDGQTDFFDYLDFVQDFSDCS